MRSSADATFFLSTNDSFKTPAIIKRKMNQRKQLIARLKLNPAESMKQRLKNLNVEIKNNFYERKKQNIRRNTIPGNGKSLWRAVSKARDLNDEHIPD